MSAVSLALISAFLNAMNKCVFRFVLREHGDPLAMTIIVNLGAGLILLFSLDYGSLAASVPHSWHLLGASAMFWTLAGYLDAKSHQHLDAAVNAVMGSLRYLMLCAGAVLVFGETFSPYRVAGSALIVLSVLATIQLSSHHYRKGALFRLISLTLINVAILIDKELTHSIAPPLIALNSFIVPGIVCTLLAPKKLLCIVPEITRTRGAILFAPVLMAAIYYSYVLSFSKGDLIVTNAIGQSSVIITWLFAVLFLGERSQLIRRGSAALLCAAGAWLVSIG